MQLTLNRRMWRKDSHNKTVRYNYKQIQYQQISKEGNIISTIKERKLNWSFNLFILLIFIGVVATNRLGTGLAYLTCKILFGWLFKIPEFKYLLLKHVFSISSPSLPLCAVRPSRHFKWFYWCSEPVDQPVSMKQSFAVTGQG